MVILCASVDTIDGSCDIKPAKEKFLGVHATFLTVQNSVAFLDNITMLNFLSPSKHQDQKK